jgi:hypothetical protein
VLELHVSAKGVRLRESHLGHVAPPVQALLNAVGISLKYVTTLLS